MMIRNVATLVLALNALTPANAQDVAAGQALFANHCAYCHGQDAAGDGPLAGAMIIKPRDLTTLAADNGGVFPVKQVVFRIDGQQPLVSHGSPMPVFGPYFEGETAMTKAETGQPIQTSQPIVDLVAYLESLQK